jgi:gluconate 2-dehydrogenase gamma chain
MPHLRIYYRDKQPEPSAADINALAYLHEVMTVQPTSLQEKKFIVKGVGWLNDFANSQYSKVFVRLSFDEKELIPY